MNGLGCYNIVKHFDSDVLKGIYIVKNDGTQSIYVSKHRFLEANSSIII